MPLPGIENFYFMTLTTNKLECLSLAKLFIPNLMFTNRGKKGYDIFNFTSGQCIKLFLFVILPQISV
jgi:hypothetical protein